MKTTLKSRIHFIITGGTIDSVYDGARDTVVPLKKSVIPAFLKTIRPIDEFIFQQVCMKDSREIRPFDMEKILSVVRKSSYRHLVVTHGTYTMPDTARFVQAKLGKTKKTIVFTGSMIPIQGFSPSDGTFNLGFALGKIEHLPPGVHVAMNGRVFRPEEVLKNLYGGKFSSIFAQR